MSIPRLPYFFRPEWFLNAGQFFFSFFGVAMYEYVPAFFRAVFGVRVMCDYTYRVPGTCRLFFWEVRGVMGSSRPDLFDQKPVIHVIVVFQPFHPRDVIKGGTPTGISYGTHTMM